MPLANHISGPIGNHQSDSSNSTHVPNTTTWMFTTNNNIITTVDHTENNFYHLWTFSTLYGSKYHGSNSTLNSVDYYGNASSDNNSTNDSCHSSSLESSVNKNSVKRIPARVWLTVSWILVMLTIGRFV